MRARSIGLCVAASLVCACSTSRGPLFIGGVDSGSGPDAGVDAGSIDAGCELPLDEVCNGVDDDCDGEVDEGCAEVRSTILAQSSQDYGSTAVAWGESGILCALQEGLLTTYFRVGCEGCAVGGPFSVVGESIQLAPRVAADGASFVMSFNSTPRVRAIRVDAQRVTSSGAFLEETFPNFPDVAANGEGISALTWHQNSGPRRSRVLLVDSSLDTTDRTPIDLPHPTGGDSRVLRVVWTGAGFLAATYVDGLVYLTPVAIDGALGETRLFVFGATPGGYFDMVLGPRSVGMVAEQRGTLSFGQVAIDGGPLVGAEVRTVVSETERLRSVSLGASPTGWGVVYSTLSKVVLIRLGEDGAAGERTAVAPPDDANDVQAADIAWGGYTWLVAWTGREAEISTARIARVDP